MGTVSSGERTEVEVDGRTLSLSNLDKVLYPQAGFVKAQVIDYYRRIAPVLLAHLHRRPITLKRYPDGVDAEYFYEKNCPDHRPGWVGTVSVATSGRGRGTDGDSGDIDFCVIDDLATLIWVANLASLELHPYLHRADALERPCAVVFDLDPGRPAGLIEAAEVALRIREICEQLDLRVVAKTSGAKGLQVYAPLNTPVTYDDTRLFARAVAHLLERRDGDLVTANMSKDRRRGRVLVDWSQNNAHKTTVGVYSLRARSRPTVSTPLAWNEVQGAVAAEDHQRLVFETDATLARVEEHGDLFAPMHELSQALPNTPT